MTGKRAAGEKCGVRADLPERGILALYLVLFAATALLLAWFQPLQPTSPMLVNPPDEFTRIVIPRYICDHGTLPTGFEPEVQIAGYGGSYAFFPYLPYIFMGWAMRLTSLFTGQEAALTMAARCVNVASGLLMAVTVYFLSRRVFQDRAVRWAFCYIVMFWPEQLFVHTYVNTESMSLLSTAMILLALVAVYQEGPEIRHSVLLAAGLVLCLLTYYNAYGYVLAAVVLFVGSFFYPVRHPLQHPGEKCQSMFSPVSGQGREQSQNTFENGISVPSSDAGGAAGKGLVCDRSGARAGACGSRMVVRAECCALSRGFVWSCDHAEGAGAAAGDLSPDLSCAGQVDSGDVPGDGAVFADAEIVHRKLRGEQYFCGAGALFL